MGRLVAVLAGVVGAVATSSAGCSSTTDAPSHGCDVAISDVDAKGAVILATAFHDDSSDALFWNPKLMHLDVLGGDLSDKPARAFELELFGHPIADGADVSLGLPDPAGPITPMSRLTFTPAGLDAMRSSAGTVHFTTASATRLVFTLDGARMVTLDGSGKARSDAPSLTIAMKCALDVKAK